MGRRAMPTRWRIEYLGRSVTGWAVLEAGDGLGRTRRAGGRKRHDHRQRDLQRPGRRRCRRHHDHGKHRPPRGPKLQTNAATMHSPCSFADAVSADLFITRRPYLHEKRWGVAGGVTLVGIDDVLAIVGLYARAQDRYVTSRDPTGRSARTMNRGLFYWVGTRELLPAAWQWSALSSAFARRRRRASVFVAQSVLQRVQRALQMRDEMAPRFLTGPRTTTPRIRRCRRWTLSSCF